ncbi:MAG: tRNA lysidine(34) synthetase TilS [Chitinophagaceae bacterium]
MNSVARHNNNFNLQEAFISEVATKKLWGKNDSLFLACSGGLDSVVLAHLLSEANTNFTILHCNFQLRGEESNRDELFVKELATQLNVPFQVKQFDTNKEMEVRKKGVQETARNLRYEWFDEVINSDKSTTKKWLLTAHHADDQVETMMIQLFRGTGIAGLQGMKVKTGKIVRPLLFAQREYLTDYATQHQLSWVEDSSNASINYTRNFIRHKVIPLVEEVVPELASNMLMNGKRFEEIDIVYQQKIEEIKKRLIVAKENSFAIPVNKLKNIHPLDTIMHEIFSGFGFSAHQIPELKKLFEASTGKYFSSDQFRVLKNRNWLLIEPIVEQKQIIRIVEHADAVLTFDNIVLRFQQVAAGHEIKNDSQQALLNLKKLSFPLIVRKWKTGDYFYPLGMKKKKKVSRFMTDIKLSLTEKEQQWVVESDKKIVWVVGRRIDERFKIEENTTDRLLVTISQQS